MLKSYKYRIYPKRKQLLKLEEILRSCCMLYNEAKEYRDTIYRTTGKCIFYNDQSAFFKNDTEPYTNLYSQVIQDTLKRVDKAYKNFFRRVKANETPGFPRFKAQHRYKSFTFPQAGFKLDQTTSRLKVSGIGHIKVKLHRSIPKNAKIKTLTIKRCADQWYALFSCEVSPEHLEPTGKSIGIDLGLTSFIAYTDTQDKQGKIQNPKHYKKSEAKLKKRQKALSTKTKGSKNRHKARMLVAKAHQKIQNQREDFLHKLSRSIIKAYDNIIIEDLDIQKMLKDTYKNIRKSINTTSWSSFVQKLLYKAEDAGREVIKIDPKGTSSTCYQCNAYKKKELSERIHSCPCGLHLDRDIHASMNILRLGLSLANKKAEALIV